VFVAGPLHQQAFRPVGYAELSSAGWHIAFSETNEIDNQLRFQNAAFSDRDPQFTLTSKSRDEYSMVAAEESHLVDFAADVHRTLTDQLQR
jgi:hypothetical protein